MPPIEQHPLQIHQRPVQKAQSQKKHCHRRTTEHELNRVANSSSRKRAMETASVSHDEEHQHAVISFADGAKVQQNSETTKDLAKKNCLLLHHSALIAGASARQLKQSWHRVPSIRKINQLSCQAGSKWWKVIQAFRLQRYEENWYYTHFLAQILVLYPFFGAKLDIISTFHVKMSSQLDFTSTFD